MYLPAQGEGFWMPVSSGQWPISLSTSLFWFGFSFYSCLPSTYFAVLTTEVRTKLGGFKSTIPYSIVAQFCELEGPRLLESDQNKNLVT